ncbi:hypothetical protein TNCV_2294931 [Trichonephila clavipes]|nr:hypothetical protein TNCV_2294931 [Trichonephila clavipes]
MDKKECCCNEYKNYVDEYHGHVITGNLEIVQDQKLREIMSKGTGYRLTISNSNLNEDYEFCPLRTVLFVDHGTGSELLHLRHRRSEIIDSLGFSSAVQRCDRLKVTDLNCKLDAPELPTSYGSVPRHTTWRRVALYCSAEL